MKKIALLLLLVFTLSLCGCGEDNKKKVLEVDIEYYAKLGQMTDCEFALGGDIKKLEDLVQESYEKGHSDNEDEPVYVEYEYEDYTGILSGTLSYYYMNDKKDNGIGCIVSLNGGYGFSKDSVAIDVRDTLAGAGFEAEEKPAEDTETFFLPSFGDFTCLTYKFGDNTVKFIFENNALCACTVSGVDWSL